MTATACVLCTYTCIAAAHLCSTATLFTANFNHSGSGLFWCRWESQEDAFKKRISQLEWNEELYNTLQVEKDVKVRSILLGRIVTPLPAPPRKSQKNQPGPHHGRTENCRNGKKPLMS
jgi:hypothetical protein